MSVKSGSLVVTLVAVLLLTGCAYDRVPRVASYSFTRNSTSTQQRVTGGMTDVRGEFSRSLS